MEFKKNFRVGGTFFFFGAGIDTDAVLAVSDRVFLEGSNRDGRKCDLKRR